MNKLSPVVSEFETEEEAASYDRWFRAKVEKPLVDTRPGIPHDEAMARIRRTLEGLKRASSDGIASDLARRRVQ